jgi:hypothetical protein
MSDLQVCRRLRRADATLVVMFWLLMYTVTRRVVDLMVLRLRGDAAKDVELLVLRLCVPVTVSHSLICGFAGTGA